MLKAVFAQCGAASTDADWFRKPVGVRFSLGCHIATAAIGCIRVSEFEITGNVYSNAAAGLLGLAAELLAAAKSVEALQGELVAAGS